MAKHYDNTNRGVLFKNEDKTADNHPDYKGKIDVDGTEFWLSAWVKESSEGKKFMSLSVTPKQAKGAVKKDRIEEANRKARAAADEIPF